MRLIDADKLVEDLTKAAEISEKTFSDSEKVVEIFTAFIGYINNIPTAPIATPAKPLPLYPDKTPSTFEGRCPVCDNTINALEDYCFKCGQRLYWHINEMRRTNSIKE